MLHPRPVAMLRCRRGAVRVVARGYCRRHVHAARATSGITSESPPTFAGDVAPIVYGHCAVCHRPGQAAPFSAARYDDVKKRGGADRRGHGAPATCRRGTRRRRRDSRSSATIAGCPTPRSTTLRRWVDSGMPRGDLPKAPQPPVFPRAGRSANPTSCCRSRARSTCRPTAPISIATSCSRWTCRTTSGSPRSTIEPSARKAVHHALFFLAPAATSGHRRKRRPARHQRAALARPRTRAWSGADAAVGQAGGAARHRRLGAGHDAAVLSRRHRAVAARAHERRRPAASASVRQGRARRRAGWRSTSRRQPPAKSLTSIQVPPHVRLRDGHRHPGRRARYTINDSFVLPVDVEALGARGHAHYLAKEMKMTATLPDGSTKGLLWIGDWDFGWQDSYFFKTPFVLPKGTRLDVEIAYDNSADNAAQPQRAAQTRELGPRIVRRDGQHDAARRRARRARSRGAPRGAGRRTFGNS